MCKLTKNEIMNTAKITKISNYHENYYRNTDKLITGGKIIVMSVCFPRHLNLYEGRVFF